MILYACPTHSLPVAEPGSAFSVLLRSNDSLASDACKQIWARHSQPLSDALGGSVEDFDRRASSAKAAAIQV